MKEYCAKIVFAAAVLYFLLSGKDKLAFIFYCLFIAWLCCQLFTATMAMFKNRLFGLVFVGAVGSFSGYAAMAYGLAAERTLPFWAGVSAMAISFLTMGRMIWREKHGFNGRV